MGLEGWSGLGESGEGGLGLVVAVEGGGQGDSTVPGKGGGCAIRWGLALGTLIWEEKWLGRGIKTCAWERNRGSSWPLPTFFHHRVHT